MKRAVVLLLSVLMLFCFGCRNADNTKNTTPEIPNIGSDDTVDDSAHEEEKSSVHGSVTFTGINDSDVTVEVLGRYKDEAANNPNVREAEMLYGAIEYKKRHPEQAVTVKLASFHLSVVAAACLNKSNAKYGSMTSLYDCEYNDDYVRISYLLVAAAKYGIDVTAIGQINASDVWQLAENGDEYGRPDYNFDEYFASHLDDDCVQGVQGKVGDHLRYYKSYWTSYGDRSAADMMHLKLCTVSHMYEDGKEKRYGLWQSSTNLDGIDYRGWNGNNSQQSGVVVWEHAKMYAVANNVLDLAAKYSGQEDILEFREALVSRALAQYAQIKAGNGDEIADNEQVIYMGTDKDPVFELYFTPLGHAVGAWDTEWNPYAKYISRLSDSTEHIEFSASNSNFSDCAFTRIWNATLLQAFTKVNSPKSRLRLDYNVNGFDFSAVQVGVNAEYKVIQQHDIHAKDVQLSFAENGQRQYVSILSTTNIHIGAFSYQANSMMVIKENATRGNGFYRLFGKHNGFGAIA